MPEAVIIAAMITTGGVLVAQEEQRKAQSKAQSKATKAAAIAQEKQLSLDTLAGEHWETLTADQMKMQAQTYQMNTLLDLITMEGKSEPAGQVLTLPAAKAPPAPLERINQAIDDLIGGYV